MSYILDALRRADAERQRGAVPGLHDQPALLQSEAGGPAPPATAARGLWRAGGGVLLAAALAAAWWLGRGSPAPGDATTVAGMPAPVPQPQAQPQHQPQPQVLTPPVPQAVPAMPVPLPPPASAPSAAARPPAALAQRPAPAPPRPPAPAPAPDRPAMQPPAPVDIDPVRPWASVGEAARAGMPALAGSGVVHAERAEPRLVIVNGQVAREGDMLGNGLQLLQIRPKSVVLRWQGQRVEMPL